MLQSMLILLALVNGLQAQDEQKPVFVAPEPKRQTDSDRPYVLSQLLLGQNQAWIGSLPELLKYYRKATTIPTPVECNALSLSDPRLAETSLLYITASSGPVPQLGEYERRKLGAFLQRGGLIFAEGFGWSIAGLTGTPLEQLYDALMQDSLAVGLHGAQWQSISNKHPLNTSYFDFSGGPPVYGGGGGNPDILRILELRGRVLAIQSWLGLGFAFGDVEAAGREACLQYGVNLIVFGMAQRAAGAPLRGGPR